MDELPIPQIAVWDQLDEEQKSAVIEILARLMARMIVAEKQSGVINDG
jgi:hypothetical protein